MTAKRATVTIHGRVQGVGFRFATRREAERHGLSGWARNTARGTVEAVFEGDEAAIEAMVAWCRRGPVRARVSRVDLAWSEATGEFSGFHITG
jgi:acylphosphatase